MALLKALAVMAMGTLLPDHLHNYLANAEVVEYTWALRPRRAHPNDPKLSPDCNLDRLLLFVDDEFPGPALRANVGDTVRVTMVNDSPTEGLALHFHGLAMKGQPYVDGTATVTQCAAGPMQTQVYEFVVHDVGTHYWHGHVSMERGDGFQGPIIISDPDNQHEKQLEEMYDKEAVVFLQDWYHMNGNMRRTGLDTNPFIWIGNAQTFLINGGGVFSPCLSSDAADSGYNCADNCSADNYVKSLDVMAGETYRLRIIAGTELIGINFAIKGHVMTVVEVEGTVVEPFVVENLDIMPAQRFSVLVTMDQAPGNYWATTSVRYRSVAPTGYINIRYAGAPESGLDLDANLPDHPLWNDTQPSIDLENQLFTKDVSIYEDSDVLTAAPESIRRIIIVGTQANDPVQDLLRWTANNVTMTMPAKPVILSAYEAVHADEAMPWPDTVISDTVVVPDSPPTPWNYTEPVQDSVGIYNGDRGPSYIPLTEGEVVEVVLQNARALNGVAEMHSWHLHGHSFYVVGFGFGTFDPDTDVATYNLDNPVRRDTASVLPLGWTAFRFKANNPGAWAFHCTQPAHAMMGMGFNFITSPDELEIPPYSTRSCLETSFVDAPEEDDDEDDGDSEDGDGDGDGGDKGGTEPSGAMPPMINMMGPAGTLLGGLLLAFV